ncbi:hypothetical protein JYK14_21135 [Siccirubricoccus sp. KC 17139]|uniref:Uncharacterized protein n=1 Tax=Siccirubricoccus soli TaxID=2899147 RepID=A0ABT1D9M8_9PROT|nr:hypothetical protein [Siccirubricoccus soli]MCO6418640.1 hypothetical protein [Siccirubricoccus soli]MCP2684775.1 hypothetical protein [Siccirubricoccus soli]
MPDGTAIIAACEAEWDAHKSDCSGYLKAVARRFDITVIGQANAIIAALRQGWQQALDGPSAAALATAGHFVIGGLEAEPNGHVVIVVPGELNRGRYPRAYWGKLGGIGRRNETINWSWNAADRDRIGYWHSQAPVG